jgi:hypothetical protein
MRMRHIEFEGPSMKFLGQALSVLFGLACLGVLGVGGYHALKLLIELFGSLQSQVAAVTAIASGVALLVAVIIANGIRQVSMSNKIHQLQAERVATYQHFTDLWQELLRHGREEGQGPCTLSEELLALDRRLILYASPEVVKAHTVLRALERDRKAHDPQVRLQAGKVVLEMRKDLGTGAQGCTAEELQQLLLADSGKVRASVEVNLYRDLQPRVSLAPNS